MSMKKALLAHGQKFREKRGGSEKLVPFLSGPLRSSVLEISKSRVVSAEDVIPNALALYDALRREFGAGSTVWVRVHPERKSAGAPVEQELKLSDLEGKGD
jgi:hypothetical protein